MTRFGGAALAFTSGWIALSYEMVWYRAYSVAFMARPQAFGVLLGGYLAGLALGAWAGRQVCLRVPERDRLARHLGWVVLWSGVPAFLLIPVFARLVTVRSGWDAAIVLAAIGASALGMVFPLVVHAAVPVSAAVGHRTSQLYMANIAGSATGSVVTGFWLMDRVGLAALTTTLSGCALVTGLIVLLASSRGRNWRGPVAVSVVLMGTALWARPFLFSDLYERLMFRRDYTPGRQFAQVVENRSGVIGVTTDGAVWGSGVYDGHYNTDLHLASVNLIHEAYAIGLFHPAPRRVLMIGLSSGSWAAVVANHSAVEQLTVVEINPGYVGLLATHPVVSHLTTDPRVRIVIDDGRHWLVKHPAERFDAIVANTTYHWRANASSLLSVEFLELVRQHLMPGGVYYFNATSQPRVEKTASTVFPHAWRLYNMMAVSDAPIRPDRAGFTRVLEGYRVYGQPALDRTRQEDRELLDLITSDMAADLEGREAILDRTANVPLITDDNMGTEWSIVHR